MKFKVGDKVRILDASSIGFAVLTNGKVYEVIESFRDEFDLVDDEGDVIFIDESEFDFVEKVTSKPSKNQRIAELEEITKHFRNELDRAFEIEKDLIKRIEVLEFVLAEKSKITPSTITVDDLHEKIVSEPNPNQQRAEIIEKAKKFVERYGALNIEFVVNEKERTVLAIWYKQNDVKSAFTKCHPNDVFDEFIGKAIALGRLLGMSNVSEFEQAVQPNEYFPGTVILTPGGRLYTCKYHHEYKDIPSNERIINDTHAIYETEVK